MGTEHFYYRVVMTDGQELRHLTYDEVLPWITGDNMNKWTDVLFDDRP